MQSKFKSYRVSYFKDGKLTRSFTIKKETQTFMQLRVAVNKMPGERYKIEEIKSDEPA